MNRMKEVAELLGVELGEVFIVNFNNGNSESCTFNESGLKHTRYCEDVLFKLLTGQAEIIKKPWVPKIGEKYYYPIPLQSLFNSHRWSADETDFTIKRNVGVYRTEEEAIAKAKELGWT